ncbi:MAG: hypothetical protein H0X33_12185 [Taibaiella sp.]|nr:hypothetical protein [Taibaiella sp.]
MKKVILILVVIGAALAGKAQDATVKTLEVDKRSGLVSVNGTPSFYMIAKAVVAWEADYSLQGMDHRELAYFKLAKGYRYNNTVHNHDQVQYYSLTFANTGAHCNIWKYLTDRTIVRSLARMVAEAQLIKGSSIDEENEKRFVLAHEGWLTPDGANATLPTSGTVPGNDSFNGPITMHNDFINYGQEVVGTYKTKNIDSELTLVQIYNVARTEVAEATHIKGDENWTFITPVDQKKHTLKYEKEDTLQYLFRYLLRNKYL